MHELKNALLGAYEVRKTKAQKDAFISWVKEYASKLGYETTVEEKGKMICSRNIIFGNAGKAKTLITAHYDTCPQLPFPNFMTPNCWTVIILTQLVLPLLLFGVCGGVVGYGVGRLMGAMDAPPALAAILASGGMSLLCFGLLALMMFGPANPHTANDNTSGVAMVLLAMREFAGREDVAFVLFDNEEKGLLGSSAFASAHPSAMRHAFVINFDCVSDGDTLMYAYAKGAKVCPKTQEIISVLEEKAPQYGKRAMHGQSPKVLYPSDQMVFKRGTAFAALKGKKILYLDRIHTPKDTVFDESNLLCLMDVLKAVLS